MKVKYYKFKTYSKEVDWRYVKVKNISSTMNEYTFVPCDPLDSKVPVYSDTYIPTGYNEISEDEYLMESIK